MDVLSLDVVQFSFDPLCPWCYQTSRWARRLEELGCLKLRWGVFSLELNGFSKPSELFDPSRSRSAAVLRTAVTVRSEAGEAACGRFYAAIGERYFFGLEDLADRATVESALTDADLDSRLAAQAVGDRSTWDTVRDEHQRLVDEVGAFGVPTIRLNGGRGPALFGPVISEPPADDEAIELWQHTVWLARNANFHELKRSRASGPDLPYWRKFLADRAAEAAGAES